MRHDLLMPIPVFYSSRMVAPDTSMSPSSAKPAAVAASWRALGVPLEWHEPTPVTAADLARVHERGFVDDVLACRRANGFGSTSPAVAASLLFTSGAMLSAARHVLAPADGAARVGAAAAPCSGFHHAGFASAGGFCTFNGLMVTAAALRAEGLARKIGILDCDMHYGDGTDDILDVLTAAGEPARAWVTHYTAGEHFSRPNQAARFFAELPGVLRSLRDCDVVLYQAGADPHVDDPLGGWLTTAELAQRDALVFAELKALGVPVVWNLAGGYQRDDDGGISKVLLIHDNTMRECARVFLDPR